MLAKIMKANPVRAIEETSLLTLTQTLMVAGTWIGFILVATATLP